jgi:hypothetical protein
MSSIPHYLAGPCDGLLVEPELRHHDRLVIHSARFGTLHFYVRRGPDYIHAGPFDPAHVA